MNLRSVTRGDAALAASALLLLVSSFFTFYQASTDVCPGTGCSTSAWNTSLFPLLPSVVLLGLIGAGLVLVGRLLPQEPSALGIPLRAWGVVLTVASAFSALFALFGGPNAGLFGHPEATAGPQLGAFLAFLFSAANVVLAVAGPVLPVLAAPLLPQAEALTPQSPYAPQGAAGAAGVPGAEGMPAAYGQPGAAGQPGAGQHPHVGHFSPQPVQQAHPGRPFTGPEQQAATLPLPDPNAPAPAGSAGGTSADASTTRLPKPMPQDTPPGSASTVRLGSGGTPAAETAPADAPATPAFAPFWFAVPASRPLAPESDPHGAPVGELVPGTWYLAIAQRGDALLARTQEGKSGLLVDTSGIQRG